MDVVDEKDITCARTSSKKLAKPISTRRSHYSFHKLFYFYFFLHLAITPTDDESLSRCIKFNSMLVEVMIPPKKKIIVTRILRGKVERDRLGLSGSTTPYLQTSYHPTASWLQASSHSPPNLVSY